MFVQSFWAEMRTWFPAWVRKVGPTHAVLFYPEDRSEETIRPGPEFPFLRAPAARGEAGATPTPPWVVAEKQLAESPGPFSSSRQHLVLRSARS